MASDEFPSSRRARALGDIDESGGPGAVCRRSAQSWRLRGSVLANLTLETSRRLNCYAGEEGRTAILP